jgi:general stress protein YciG
MARERKFTASEFARKGGKARAAKLTKERATEIARKAAQARWAKSKRPG